MATDFPNSPANGATHTFGGNTYTYNSTMGAWTGPAGGSGGGASVTVSETAPTSPSAGDLWFDPSVLKTFLYYQDGSSNQWVQTNPSGSGGSGGASVTASDTAPSSPSAGDLWYRSDTSALYVYYNDGDSSQWVGISGPAGATGAAGAAGAAATGYGQVPIVYTEPPTAHALNNDGSTSTVQMQAVDPEGTSITYAIAYANATNARPNQLAADTTINQSTGTFTFDPSTNNAHAGSFKARLSASDGITHATRFVDFSLAFTHTLHWLVIAGGGGGGSSLPAYANGGGGGAGGYRASWNNEASGGGGSAEAAIVGSPGNVYTITVGAGGTGATASAVGTDGADSSLARTTGASMTTITSVGGGKGGFASGSAGGNGGSGGGGNHYQGTAGTGTANQGYAGGTAGGAPYGGGGGGGAGAVGQNAHVNSYSGGNGGAGVASTITGSSVERAGGGGGASAGTASGGGGAAATSPGNGTAGTANTGGGGGAGGITGSQNVTGAAGGSGVVIIRSSTQATSTTGSPTATTVGSDYVYQFNANGTITF
jgi:hypothetical protein